MQPLKRHTPLLQVALLLVMLALSGCGWKKTMAFQSPSGGARVEIWQPRIDNSMGLRFELISNGQRKLLYHSPNDAIVYFVHVTWSNNENAVGILATGTGNWQLAFETDTGKPIPFQEIQDAIRQSIAATYSISHSLDPIRWATSTDAHDAFFKLHPEFRVSYR